MSDVHMLAPRTTRLKKLGEGDVRRKIPVKFLTLWFGDDMFSVCFELLKMDDI